MKKAKKLLSMLLIAMLSFVMALSVTACGGLGNGGNDGDQTGGNTIVYEVTESEFNTAALASTYTNFKAEISNVSKANGVIISGETNDAVYTYTPDALSLDTPDGLVYYSKTSGEYFAYVQNQGVWQKTSISQNIYDSVASQVCQYASPSSMIATYGITFESLTYSETDKCYNYAPAAQPGVLMSALIKIYFENAKIVKIVMEATNAEIQEEISSICNYTYNVTVTLPEVGGAGQPDGGDEGEHVCDMQATAWFDAERHYPKTLECECGEKENRTRIQITNADELVMLGEDMNSGYNIGSALIDIANDIDMEDKQWTPIIVDNMMQEIKIRGAEGGVTISGLTSDVGFIAEVLTGLTLENITLEGASISNTEGCAGGFIGVINVGSGLATNVTIKNCSVVDSEIIASYTGDDNACFAGAIYGKMADETAIDTLTIQNCSVLNTNVQSNVYAGGIAGAFSPLVSGVTANVSLINCVFENVTVSSLVKNGAGRVVGISGFGSCNMDQETSDCANLTVTATGAGEARLDVYGVTGWNSMTDCGTLVYGAAMQLKYDHAINSLAD